MNDPVIPPLDAALAFGTIGWLDDGGTFYELGGAQNGQQDNNILVRVQLFRGRDPSTPLDSTVGQGDKLLCKLASTFIQIPPKGTRVLVAIPEPFGMIPGGSMVVHADNPNPVAIGTLAPGEAAIAPAAGVGRLLFKLDGSMTLYTQTGNTTSGNSLAAALSPSGWAVGTPWGAEQITSSGYALALSGGSGMQIDTSGHVTLIGATSIGLNGPMVSIGAGATTADGVATATSMALFLGELALLIANIGAWITPFAGSSGPPVPVTIVPGPLGVPGSATSISTIATALATYLGAAYAANFSTSVTAGS